MHLTNAYDAMPLAFITENRIRVWWTTYILERTLGVLMGRPSQIRDEDIDTEAASDVVEFVLPVGLHAHVDLAGIMGVIISDVYSIHGRKEDKRAIDHVMLTMQLWKDSLPPQLRLDDELPEPAEPNFTAIALRILYNQVASSSTILINS
jgi:hypothetical protein